MKKILKTLSKNGLLVFILPLVGYLFTYIFQVGYLSYYKVPASFVKIEIVDLAYSGIVIVVLIYFMLAHFAVDNIKSDRKYWSHFRKHFIYIFFAFIFMVIYLFLFSAQTIDYMAKIILVLLIGVGLLLLWFLAAFFSFITYKTDIEEDKNSKKYKKFDQKIIGLFTILLFTLAALFTGKFMAWQKVSHMIIEGEQKLVAITQYKNGFLTTPLEGGTIVPKYSYTEITEDTITYIEVTGRLKIADIENDD